jgi:ATP:ADP antiporter, AAA family
VTWYCKGFLTMANKIVRALWGDLKGDELKKFILLAAGFFFLVGSYWPLKTLKDSIFVNFVGPEYQPIAKYFSLALFFPLVLIYSRLVDIFTKEKMVYLLLAFYGLLGFVFVYFFYHPTIGLSNLSMGPGRLLGWLFFLYVESYISLIISLFWSYVNDITSPESAKKGYGLIIFGTQLGGFSFILLGSIISSDTQSYATRSPIIALFSICMFFMIGLITFLLNKNTKKEGRGNYSDINYKKNSPPKKQEYPSGSFFGGLRVFMTSPYVAGIFFIMFFHELISTVMYYQMILMVKTTYIDPGKVNKFLFDYALAVQGIACLFGLLGTSFFQRRFGIRFCIVAYPILLGISILFYLFYPMLGSIFYVMLIAKAINYAFNQPAKEILYIPTSRDIKYKSKAWVDMFGLRFAKSAGSTINLFAGKIVNITGGIVISLIIIWVFMANAIGNIFKRATVENKIIK